MSWQQRSDSVPSQLSLCEDLFSGLKKKQQKKKHCTFFSVEKGFMFQVRQTEV